MSAVLLALVASGIAGAALGAATIARRVARSGAPRETRGWATAAGFALGAALAPWAFTSALLGGMPETGSVRRVVVRAEGSSPEQVRSLVGEPRTARCEEVRELSRVEGDYPPSGALSVVAIFRCEGAPFLHRSEAGSSEGRRWGYSVVAHDEWFCDSSAEIEPGRAFERRRELRVRRSRDGHLLEFSCVRVACGPPERDACRSPYHAPNPLYFAAEPVSLEHRGAVTATFAAAVALALAWVLRHTPRAPSLALTAPYRDRPPPPRVPAARAPLRLALISITFAFGAAAAVSWAVVAYAFSP